MSKNPKRGRPRGSSPYCKQDELALERMHKLVVSDRMPVTTAARKIADDMNLLGSYPEERLRKKYARHRDEIAAMMASRAAAQEPRPQTFETRMLEEARRLAISPLAPSAHPDALAMTPEMEAQLKQAREDFEHFRQTERFYRLPPWS
jgi:hypothetical protein